MESCQYSIHDMSSVQLDRRPPPTPRFNMPFELGLAVGYHTRRANREHTWFVFETRPWRLQKSLSDLNGTDVYTHGGTPAGVFRELLSAFVRHHNQPTVRQMTVIFEALQKNLRPILQETGAASPFDGLSARELEVAMMLAQGHSAQIIAKRLKLSAKTVATYK